MLRNFVTLLMAVGLVFWLADDSADAKRAKRGGFGKTSYVGMTSTGKVRKRRIARNFSMTRRKIASSRLQIQVSIASQSMQVTQQGRVIANWRVSTGREGFATPRGYFRVGRMHRTYFSRKYDNAPMPNAMFFYGGVAIHGSNHVRQLGRPASHGCVRLHPSNAAQLFSLVQRYGGNVRIY